MIDFDFIQISSISDYAKLGELLYSTLPHSNHKHLVKELERRIGIQAKLLVIEFPYRDFDFSSVYSIFYSKKHQSVSKECIRVHLFSKNELEEKYYIGNIVVRDSVIDSRGKAIFEPKYLSQVSKGFIVKSENKAHLMGKTFKIDSFLWMSQDTDISVCAHVSIWSINNYFANKYSSYKLQSIGAISEIVPLHMGRKTPSNGLNLLQISDMFSKLGFYPLVLQKDSQNPKDFFRAVYSYIESGIPMVGAMTQIGHAVAIIGHGEISQTGIENSSDTIINIADHLQELIISDDNELPFTTITRCKNRYTFDDLDYVIVPLYEKMYTNANIVYERVKTLMESDVLKSDAQTIVRVYLTSARSLKREALENKKMNDILKSTILKLHTPQFVWCADLCTKDEYKDEKTSSRIIIDATSGTYENEPWLLMHDSEKILYKDDYDVYSIAESIANYDMYKNNLKEI